MAEFGAVEKLLNAEKARNERFERELATENTSLFGIRIKLRDRNIFGLQI